MPGMSAAANEAAKGVRKTQKKVKKAQSRSRFCKGGFSYDPKRRICVKTKSKVKSSDKAQESKSTKSETPVASEKEAPVMRIGSMMGRTHRF